MSAGANHGASPVNVGRRLLGPILAEFALRLWLFAESRPENARILFCARGGLRLRLLYETFLLRIGKPSPTPFDDLMVARLVAARPALLARATAAMDEISREFEGDTMHAVVRALVQIDLAIDAEWHGPFDRARFERLLWSNDAAGVAIRAALVAQNDLFAEHFEEKAAGAQRVILCDTGLYGSTMRLLQAAWPERDLSCVMIARCNYKGFATEHFARTVGLCVQSDGYSRLDLRSSMFRFWHLIEHVLEPDLQSVRLFSRDGRGRVVSNLECDDWRSRIEPREGEIFAGALDYVRALQPSSFATQIYRDTAAAWPEFRRLMTRPRRKDLDALGIGERSRDFGRLDTVAANAARGAPASLQDLRNSLWREGAAAAAHPAARGLLQTGLECVHVLRGARRVARRLVERTNAGEARR